MSLDNSKSISTDRGIPNSKYPLLSEVLVKTRIETSNFHSTSISVSSSSTVLLPSSITTAVLANGLTTLQKDGLMAFPGATMGTWSSGQIKNVSGKVINKVYLRDNTTRQKIIVNDSEVFGLIQTVATDGQANTGTNTQISFFYYDTSGVIIETALNTSINVALKFVKGLVLDDAFVDDDSNMEVAEDSASSVFFKADNLTQLESLTGTSDGDTCYVVSEGAWYSRKAYADADHVVNSPVYVSVQGTIASIWCLSKANTARELEIDTAIETDYGNNPSAYAGIIAPSEGYGMFLSHAVSTHIENNFSSHNYTIKELYGNYEDDGSDSGRVTGVLLLSTYYSNTGHTDTTVIYPPGGINNGMFGQKCGISNDFIVTGINSSDNIYIYDSEGAYLYTFTVSGDIRNIALNGNWLAVATTYSGSQTSQGRIEVYVLSSSTQTLLGLLTHSPTTTHNDLGQSNLSISPTKGGGVQDNSVIATYEQSNGITGPVRILSFIWNGSSFNPAIEIDTGDDINGSISTYSVGSDFVSNYKQPGTGFGYISYNKYNPIAKAYDSSMFKTGEKGLCVGSLSGRLYETSGEYQSYIAYVCDNLSSYLNNVVKLVNTKTGDSFTLSIAGLQEKGITISENHAEYIHVEYVEDPRLKECRMIVLWICNANKMYRVVLTEREVKRVSEGMDAPFTV